MNFYKIAGLNLAVDGVEFEYFNSRMKNYEVDFFNNADISVKFQYDNSIDLKMPDAFVTRNGRSYYETKNEIGFYDYIDEVDRYVSFMKTNKKWSDFSYTYSDLTDLFGIAPDLTVVNVLGHLFEQGLRHFDGAVLHASTIMYNGKAVTFTAPSGTGKSTHTGLWKKYYPETVIINDDMPAIRKVDGTYRAFGTPWAGKTHINENVSAPLYAMVFIERAEECSITEMVPMEAVIRMMREIPISVYKGQSDLLLDFYNDLFKTVPAYLLKCNISRDAVEVVKDKLML